ncbi:MAG: hypothetical protein LDL41_22445 [Coleofasciculus sp. S288]|nr:hypothetical protein [Coleofasciculus sp. S288]
MMIPTISTIPIQQLMSSDRLRIKKSGLNADMIARTLLPYMIIHRME